jgi:membrane associated rhomboid family serine protease
MYGEITLGVTSIIIALTVLVSTSAFGNRHLFINLLFEPFVMKARGQWYRLLTHGFVHTDWSHLLVNMFVLFMFGREVEYNYSVLTGTPAVASYLALYFGGMIFSSLPALMRYARDPNYRAVGASGAVSSVLFAHILMKPTSSVYFMLIPIPIPAYVFGILYLFYSWYMDKRGGDNVAHDAHFYGAVFGILFTAALSPDLLLHIGDFQHTLGE